MKRRAAYSGPAAGTPRVAGSSHQAGGRGTAGSGAVAPGDKGKCPRAFVPQPSSLSSPWPPRPPKDPAGDQMRPEVPSPALAFEPSAPTPEPSMPMELEPQGPPCPEPRAAAAPEQPAPSEPTLSSSRAEQAAVVEVVAARAAPTWQSSGTLSASAKRAQAAVATERAELDRYRTALVEERGRLEEVGWLLEARITLARATHERSMCAVAEEREALEEVRDEAVAVQEDASRMEQHCSGGPLSCLLRSGWSGLGKWRSASARNLWSPPGQT
ncbi:predicted GPI-anchored protein 58 [Phragmites australis]|uniref:predicted GPI-anchored protein 58 n=1 Tax=Phragmites australis TaxID=29695 RepID=UPI002D7786CF|nr:predicted GPI-anchored protein 58 [Phragmites australis]